jgi:hypothetical protein
MMATLTAGLLVPERPMMKKRQRRRRERLA